MLVQENNVELEDFKSAINQIHKLSKSFGTLRTNAIELASTLVHLEDCERTLRSSRSAAVLPEDQEDRICNISLQISSCQAMQRWIESYERRVQVQFNLVCDETDLEFAYIIYLT